MHILHLVNNCNRGGAGHVILPLINEMTKHDVSFTVAYLIGPEKLKSDYIKYGAKTVLLGKNPVIIFFKLKNIITNNENPVSLIHTHLVQASLVGRFAGKIFKTPVITTRHYKNRSKKNNLLHILEDLTLRWSNYTIAISHAVKKYLIFSRFVPNKKCSTIYNPIDINLFKPVNNVELFLKNNIVFIGRFNTIKGIEYLIDAFNIVAESIPKSKLVLIGRNDGNEKLLNKMIDNHPFKNQIKLLGFINHNEIKEELKKARVYVQPSLSEGLGLSAIEAMAMECPCIFSDVGGLSELSDNYRNAVLVPPKNSNILSKEIISIWHDQKKSQSLGKSARKYICKYFNSKIIANQYYAVYKDMTNYFN